MTKAKAIVMHGATNFLLAVFIFAALLAYFYLNYTGVQMLTVLEKTKLSAESVSTNVSDMESKRLAAENQINRQKAVSLGFVEAAHPTFIIKSSQKTALSLRR